MVMSRFLTHLRTAGLDVFGRSLRYTRLRSIDEHEPDDYTGGYELSRHGSPAGSSQNVADLADSTFGLSTRKLEDGRTRSPEPFLRPLQPEQRGLARQLRIWVVSLLVFVVLLAVSCHRFVKSGIERGRDDPSVVVEGSTEAGPSGAVDEMLIDDPSEKPSLPMGTFQDGFANFDNPASLDKVHKGVTDLLGLTWKADVNGTGHFDLSTKASDLYMIIKPERHPEQPKTWPSLRPVPGLSGSQLESWFIDGIMTDSRAESRLPEAPVLDVVMTWVNGSDPLWLLERSKQVRKHKLLYRIATLGRHWRENGMGPYLLRSIVEAFSQPKGESVLRKIHVVTADVQPDGVGFSYTPAADGTNSSFARARLQNPLEAWTIGQIPSWVNQSQFVSVLDNDVPTESPRVGLQWHFHSEAFQLPDQYFESAAISNDSVQWRDAAEWKREALPTYNSFAIEWQMGWLKGVSDLSVHMNDDMLFLAPLTVADFYSIPFGSVFRLDSTFQLRVTPTLDRTKSTDAGEWGGLEHANYLLSQRFPDRSRHYLHHLPKTLSKPIIHEAMHMFGKDIAVASSRPFRESTVGNGDIEMAFLVTHLRIERWREALLWIWAVGKMGNLDPNEQGRWGVAARAALRSLLELETLGGTPLVVKQERDTLKNMDSVFRKGTWDTPKATTYSFSSMDGHLPPLMLWAREGPETCVFKVEQCLGEAFVNGTQDPSADAIFKRLTFGDWRCGDCLINALVNKSGKKGLSAFFPDKDVVVPNATVDFEVAHLPLTPDWRDTDFSLEAVTKGDGQAVDLNLRIWGVKMLSRYLYSTGDTPSHFVTLNNAIQARKLVAKLDTDPSIAMVCFNDDVRYRQEEKVSDVLHGWLDRKFTGKDMYWENSV